MQIKTYHSFHPEHIFLYERILHLLEPAKASYPKLEKWYRHTFLPGLKKRERAYVMIHDAETLVGCALLKRTADEKKISSLFVHPDYRQKGVGEKLLTVAMKDLGPGVSLTVSEENLSSLQPLLQKFEFTLTSSRKGFYVRDKKEYFFKSSRVIFPPRKERSL